MQDTPGQTGDIPDLRIMDGAPVYDMNGVKVGSVSDRGLQRNALIVHKGIFFPKDLYVPLSAVSSYDANGVYLNVAKDEINSHNWDTMPMDEGAMDARHASAGQTGGMRGDEVDTSTGEAQTGYEHMGQYSALDRPEQSPDEPLLP